MDNFIHDTNAILQLLAQEWPWLLPVIIVVLGGVIGSFLGCMLYRVPRGISLSYPPSYCPHCRTKLKFFDLIPVFSYLIFRGKCRHCGENISPRYVRIELLTIIIFALVYRGVGPQFALLPALIAAGCALFALGLWAESKQIAFKVLLAFIIIVTVLAYTLR